MYGDWLIIGIVMVLGAIQMWCEGKLNFKGLILEPLATILSLFKRN